MPDEAPGTASALSASLLALGSLPQDVSEEARHAGDLERARQLWGAHARGFGLVLLDDHDPHVAPGLHVARTGELPSRSRLQQLTRSWEAFDRAFEACPEALERALFDERLAPCFATLGLDIARVDLAQDHLFVIDERYVASFPAERWEPHAARRAAASVEVASRDHERLLRGLRLVCAAA